MVFSYYSARNYLSKMRANVPRVKRVVV
jgi:hypothetical protein